VHRRADLLSVADRTTSAALPCPPAGKLVHGIQLRQPGNQVPRQTLAEATSRCTARPCPRAGTRHPGPRPSARETRRSQNRDSPRPDGAVVELDRGARAPIAPRPSAWSPCADPGPAKVEGVLSGSSTTSSGTSDCRSQVSRVSNAGCFRLHSGRILPSQAIDGEENGLEQIADGLWNTLSRRIPRRPAKGARHTEARNRAGSPKCATPWALLPSAHLPLDPRDDPHVHP